ncbi:MAG TPA: hypothetical protein VKA69_07325 [Desulfobacteria bacterium]|nr:hypothetical protein [Desulfobacteria bacterium]
MKFIQFIFPTNAVKHGVSLSLLAVEQVINEAGYKGLFKMLLGLILFWHIYVPVHELLHVSGCLLGGGEVESLNLKPQYGGWILQKLFPFVIPESDYAGRLTGFKTPNSWAYALVDLFPYSISFFGITLIEFCRRKKLAVLLGLGIILAFVPFISIPGDYYEAVSLATTQLGEAINPALQAGAFVSDDVFRSIKQLGEAGTLDWSFGALIFLGFLLAAYLAFMTFALQVWISELFFRRDR